MNEEKEIEAAEEGGKVCVCVCSQKQKEKQQRVTRSAKPRVSTSERRELKDTLVSAQKRGNSGLYLRLDSRCFRSEGEEEEELVPRR